MKQQRITPGLTTLFCVGILLLASPAEGLHAQAMTRAEVESTGAKPLDADKARELVSGATLVFSAYSFRWSAKADGTGNGSRVTNSGALQSGSGKWSVQDNGELCIEVTWRAMDVTSWCRQIYPVESRYYAYALKAAPNTPGGSFVVTR